jgi:hypothetical protein
MPLLGLGGRWTVDGGGHKQSPTGQKVGALTRSRVHWQSQGGHIYLHLGKGLSPCRTIWQKIFVYIKSCLPVVDIAI